jgi:hypothetical protein
VLPHTARLLALLPPLLELVLHTDVPAALSHARFLGVRASGRISVRALVRAPNPPRSAHSRPPGAQGPTPHSPRGNDRMFEIRGLDEAMQQLNRLQRNAEALSGPHDILRLSISGRPIRRI